MDDFHARLLIAERHLDALRERCAHLETRLDRQAQGLATGLVALLVAAVSVIVMLAVR